MSVSFSPISDTYNIRTHSHKIPKSSYIISERNAFFVKKIMQMFSILVLVVPGVKKSQTLSKIVITQHGKYS